MTRPGEKPYKMASFMILQFLRGSLPLKARLVPPYTLNPALYALHPTPYTPAPYTLHPTPYTLHPTP